MAILPNLCLWWRSLCSNVGGIDPEKLYRAVLNVDWNEKRLPGKCMSCHARIHLSKFWPSAGGGVGGLSLECGQKRNQKRDQANVKLRKLFPKILSQAEHEKFQSRFLLEQLRCFPCWLCLRQNETQRICLGLPSLPFPTEFFYPTPIVCTGRLSYADVITKFSGMYIYVWGSAVILIKCSLNKYFAGLCHFRFTCETSWMILIWTFLYIVPVCTGLACEKSLRLGSGEESFSLPPYWPFRIILHSARANNNKKLYWYDYNRRVL